MAASCARLLWMRMRMLAVLFFFSAYVVSSPAAPASFRERPATAHLLSVASLLCASVPSSGQDRLDGTRSQQSCVSSLLGQFPLLATRRRDGCAFLPASERVSVFVRKASSTTTRGLLREAHGSLTATGRFLGFLGSLACVLVSLLPPAFRGAAASLKYRPRLHGHKQRWACERQGMINKTDAASNSFQRITTRPAQLARRPSEASCCRSLGLRQCRTVSWSVNC